MDADGMKVNILNKLTFQEHELHDIVPSESDRFLADCDCEILCDVGARFSDCQRVTLSFIGEQQSLALTTCREEKKILNLGRLMKRHLTGLHFSVYIASLNLLTEP